MSPQEVRTENGMFAFRLLLSSSLSTGRIFNPSSLFTYYHFTSESCWEALICPQNVSKATDLNLAQIQ